MVKKLHPTCGLISLQLGTKIIAFVDMILGLLGIIWFVFMLSRYEIISLEPFEQVEDNINTTKLDTLGGSLQASKTNQGKALATNHKVISLLLSAFYTTVNLSVFIILIVGAHRKSIGLCLTWFYIRCSVIVFKLIIYVMYLIAGRPLFSQIPYIINILIHIYGLWVVNRYVEELRHQRRNDKLAEFKAKQLDRVNQDWEAGGIENIQKNRAKVYSTGGGILGNLGNDNEAFKDTQDEKS